MKKLPFEQAFEPFAHYPEVLTARFCGGKRDEDMEQEARIACFKSYTSHYHPGSGSLSTFFYNVIRNQTHFRIKQDVRNRERFGYAVSEFEPAETGNPADMLDTLDTSIRVRNALNQLTERERMVCSLFYYRDMELQQIAVRLRIGRGSVSNALRTGTDKLRELLR